MIDYFECLHNSVVEVILKKIGDYKALGICCMVCRRFRSLVPEADLFVWQMQLPYKYLSNDQDLWNDDDFLPQSSLKAYRQEFRLIYSRYFRQIIQSQGFDIDVYPGKAKAALYVPYVDFEIEAEMLKELANYAMEEFNKTSVYKYRVLDIETVNFILSRHREFFMTVKVKNLMIASEVTFRIRAHKGLDGEKIVSFCRPKRIVKTQGTLEETLSSALESVWKSRFFCSVKEQREELRKVHLRYWIQICQSEGFDIDEYPFCRRVPFVPYLFDRRHMVLKKMADHAILEYNERESSVFKYEVLETEKVNLLEAACVQEYFNTVKVRNLTLGTIETFQISGYYRWSGFRGYAFFISLCRPKEEVLKPDIGRLLSYARSGSSVYLFRH